MLQDRVLYSLHCTGCRPALENSIKNSAHLHGKTFDVSYAAFTSNSRQLGLFIETISLLRRQNKCYVKFERNGCLHITVN